MEKQTVKQYLLKPRLSNYGYDWRWFRKMQQVKTRYKSKVAGLSDADIRRALAKEGILGKGRRLTRSGGKVEYTTGQSFNEEYLNMLVLAGSKGKKSFYQIQERWLD